MRKITYREALREGLREEMLRDERVFLLGEDIGVNGGAYKVTVGLYEEFGEERVKDTPITESAIIGAALGAAVTGMRPVPEIMFSDFLPAAMDQIVNQVAKTRYMSGGQSKIPLVIRTQNGAGISSAAQHSQSLTALFTHIPGLLVVIPSTPYDAKGLLKTAIRDDNPVMFFEHKLLYSMSGEVPEEEYTIPFGKADIKKKGTDLTLVAISYMVSKALKAAISLEKEGLSIEVIDPRTLVPFDKETIFNSVKKTKRLIIVEEECKRNGLGAEISATVSEEIFDYLDAPIRRVAAYDTPIPFSPVLEKCIIPDEEDIIKTVKEVLL